MSNLKFNYYIPKKKKSSKSRDVIYVIMFPYLVAKPKYSPRPPFPVIATIIDGILNGIGLVKDVDYILRSFVVYYNDLGLTQNYVERIEIISEKAYEILKTHFKNEKNVV